MLLLTLLLGATEIHLITMGPANHLYTAGGHAALLVAKLQDGARDPAQTLVYNFGNADWDSPSFVTDFLRGKIEFYLATTGTLDETIQTYGVGQGREIWLQKLNLTPPQMERLETRLAFLARTENRSYPYHHYRAICTTKILDLLDEVTDGTLRPQLSGDSGLTVRSILSNVFYLHDAPLLAIELFMGRPHDVPIDRYTAAFIPRLMSDYLHEVKLAEARVALTALPEGTRKLGNNPFPTIVCLLALLVLLLGLRSRAIVAAFGVVSGSIGVAIMLLALISDVPEMRANENLLVFLPTDFLAGFRLRAYALFRVGMSCLLLALHASGVFFQRPYMFIAVSVAFTAVLFARRNLLERIQA